jgi:hypothetical protein
MAAIIKQTVNCPRRMSVFAIFDTLDKLNSFYEQEYIGDIKARINIFENTSEFAFAVTDQGDSSIIHISLQSPAPELTEEGQLRALIFLRDCILQHIENECCPAVTNNNS